MRSLRGARLLVGGAACKLGRELCETLVALGAEVIAADKLRTQLIDLRSYITKVAPNQHERFHVAEVDFSDAVGLLKLVSDANRRRPLDGFVSLSAEASMIPIGKKWITGDSIGSILIQLDTLMKEQESLCRDQS